MAAEVLCFCAGADTARSAATNQGAGSPRKHPGLTKGQTFTQSKAELVAKKKQDLRESMEEAASELLAHFNHRYLGFSMKSAPE